MDARRCGVRRGTSRSCTVEAPAMERARATSVFAERAPRFLGHLFLATWGRGILRPAHLSLNRSARLHRMTLTFVGGLGAGGPVVNVNVELAATVTVNVVPLTEASKPCCMLPAALV